MLLSVLLPTRDRLEYLRHAVESVRRQEGEDWEIVVSDNDSTEDVAGYVASLEDPRIRYVRTPRFVPVTENWNNALRHSRGDYVVMLGDDDALLPGYLRALTELVARFQDPDVIYTGALLFAYPGVSPDEPGGYVQPYSYAPFFDGAEEPFLLDRGRARSLVADAMNFRVSYGFNMQYVAVRREAAFALADGSDFFRSPFPDYYAMNLLFERAPTIVVDPHERVAIGITKSSYGYFHANQREAEARALLNNEATDPEIRRDLSDVLMPGTNINTGWLLAMEALHRRLGRPADLRPDYERYRRLQAVYCYQHHYFDATVSAADLAVARRRLTARERAVLFAGAAVGGRLAKVMPTRLRRFAGALLDRVQRQYRRGWQPERTVGRYADVMELYAALDERTASAPGPARDHAGGGADGHGAGRDVVAHHRVGADDGALTDRHP